MAQDRNVRTPADVNSRLKLLLKKHEEIFQEGLGTVNTFEANLHVCKDATPKFCKAWPVPFALKEAADLELDHLVSHGILKPVMHSD